MWHKIRIVLPQPSATPRIWDFPNFTIHQLKQWFCHSTDHDVWNTSIVEVFPELLTFLFLKIPTILDKTCWDKCWSSCEFNKWFTFFWKKSPPCPRISMLNLAKFCCYQPKTSRTTWKISRKIFFSNFSQQFCPRLKFID